MMRRGQGEGEREKERKGSNEEGRKEGRKEGLRGTCCCRCMVLRPGALIFCV